MARGAGFPAGAAERCDEGPAMNDKNATALIEFLLARIRPATELAKAPAHGPSEPDVSADYVSKRMMVHAVERHLANHPGLRDGEPGWADGCEACRGPHESTLPPLTLQLLALPYSSHPDFDPAWAVEV